MKLLMYFFYHGLILLQIQLLQLRLQQEKSMRVMLEKAIGRASSTLSPGHRHFASQVSENIQKLSNTNDL